MPAASSHGQCLVSQTPATTASAGNPSDAKEYLLSPEFVLWVDNRS